jgi:hypothetical protein
MEFACRGGDDATSRVDESRFYRQWAWWTCCVTHTFTSGSGLGIWLRNSSGQPGDVQTIKAILRYTMSKRAQYPATMVTTGDHDDRVVPAHSFKFAASCRKTSRNNPKFASM